MATYLRPEHPYHRDGSCSWGGGGLERLVVISLRLTRSTPVYQATKYGGPLCSLSVRYTTSRCLKALSERVFDSPSVSGQTRGIISDHAWDGDAVGESVLTVVLMAKSLVYRVGASRRAHYTGCEAARFTVSVDW